MTYEIKYRSEEEMKDSGIEWLGKIPKEWTLSKLKFVVNEFITGGTPDSTNYNYYTEFGKGIPWVSIADMSSESIINETKSSLTQLGLRSKNLRVLGKGTLIYSIFATLGKVAELNIDATTNQAILGLINNESLTYNQYLKYWLINIEKDLKYFSSANTQENLNSSKVRNLNFLYPIEIRSQQKIANFLDYNTAEFDSIISKKELLIEKLEEAKKSLISEVVTGKVKVVDGELVERKADEMKDSGVPWLGMIPKDWDIKKIKYISKLNNKTLSNNINKNLAISYIDIASVDNTGNINEIQELVFEDAPSRARRIVCYEDTIVSTVRTYLKAIAFIDAKYDGFICSTGFAVFTPIKKLINAKYFYYVINSEEYINQIVSRSTGVSYPAINASEISNLYYVLPKFQEQDLILNALEYKSKGINSIINKTKLQIKKLKEAKQSLISEAVTGKIDLRDWEIQEI